MLLLAVGTKLEHVITQLAHEVAEKHIAIEGELVVQPLDNHFWFHRPPIVLFLIHFILFQNAFEIAFFFWIWLQYGFDSCIMGHVRFIIPKLVIGLLSIFLGTFNFWIACNIWKWRLLLSFLGVLTTLFVQFEELSAVFLCGVWITWTKKKSKKHPIEFAEELVEDADQYKWV